jgi:hypothetical protein
MIDGRWFGKKLLWSKRGTISAFAYRTEEDYESFNLQRLELKTFRMQSAELLIDHIILLLWFQVPDQNFTWAKEENCDRHFSITTQGRNLKMRPANYYAELVIKL